MQEPDPRLEEAIAATVVARVPKQYLATFGVTNIHYYLLSEPSYADLAPDDEEEVVVREGNVVSEPPAIVTPTYMLNLEGFSSNARRYMEKLEHNRDSQSPGLMYRYRNEPSEMNIVTGQIKTIAGRITTDLDGRGENSAAVIMGMDALWDVSLLKFILDYTSKSLASNVGEMNAMGLLDPDPNTRVPRAAIQRIDQLFSQVEQGLDPSVLRQELNRWGLFEYYQDRFLALFRRK